VSYKINTEINASQNKEELDLPPLDKVLDKVTSPVKKLLEDLPKKILDTDSQDSLPSV
ncbi:13069_t:CDS:1, partial [Acaulospora morrowiae]